MNSARLRLQPAKDPTALYDELADTLKARREALGQAREKMTSSQPLMWAELAEWLRFQCWYQQEEASFLRSWLVEAAGSTIYPALCRKVARDDWRHQLIRDHLESLTLSLDEWTPEPEWVNWVSEFYAGGIDILERVIAHNLTGELANRDTLTLLMPHVTADTRAVLAQLLPDLSQHNTTGRMAMKEYATTPEAQARMHAWVMRSFDLEQKAQLAFARRIRAIRNEAAANDTVGEGVMGIKGH